MKRKILALIVSLTLCLSAGLIPGMNAYAVSPAKNLTTIANQFMENISRPDAQALTVLTADDNSVAAIKIGSPTAVVNGKKTLIDAENKKVVPIKKSGRTLVPLRFSATAMGGKTKYISDKDFITVTLDDKIAKFKINSKTLQIVDSKGKVLKKITLDVAATKINGRVQVPLRAISEGLGCKVYYEKIRTDELVLVSRNKLYSDEKVYCFAQLQNLSTYTFTDKTKSYRVTLPGAWNKMEEDQGVATFVNPLYPSASYVFQKVDVADVKETMKLSKADLKEIFEELLEVEGLTLKLIDYKKYTVGGKNALRFSVTMSGEMEGETIDICINYFFIASSKTGLMANSLTETGDKAYTQFKTACNTVKLLK